jgi:hypothetical protein
VQISGYYRQLIRPADLWLLQPTHKACRSLATTANSSGVQISGFCMQLIRRADLWLIRAAHLVFRSLPLQAAHPAMKPAATTGSSHSVQIFATTGSPPNPCYYSQPTRSSLFQAAHPVLKPGATTGSSPCVQISANTGSPSGAETCAYHRQLSWL